MLDMLLIIGMALVLVIFLPCEVVLMWKYPEHWKRKSPLFRFGHLSMMLYIPASFCLLSSELWPASLFGSKLSSDLVANGTVVPNGLFDIDWLNNISVARGMALITIVMAIDILVNDLTRLPRRAEVRYRNSALYRYFAFLFFVSGGVLMFGVDLSAKTLLVGGVLGLLASVPVLWREQPLECLLHDNILWHDGEVTNPRKAIVFVILALVLLIGGLLLYFLPAVFDIVFIVVITAVLFGTTIELVQIFRLEHKLGKPIIQRRLTIDHEPKSEAP